MTTLTILVSVWDKSNLVPFLSALQEKSTLNLLATGSTCQSLRESGFDCQNVADITGFPEILDGRVKTLHPKIFGGILAKGSSDHLATLKDHDIPLIDMVVCNLYPFHEKRAQGLSLDEMIEFIDIGGVSLIRAAAKNHKRVIIACDPNDYERIQTEYTSEGLPETTRRTLAQKAFQHTAQYDASIADYFVSLPSDSQDAKSPFPPQLLLPLQKVQDLRYGENPQDAGAWYQLATPQAALPFTCLQGKELSYNNLLDIHAAYHLIRDLDDAPACCIIKHGNPCGVAYAETIEDAYQRAFDADSTSAFGGIIALNRNATKEVADAINQQFAEVVIAPSFDEAALNLFASKKNLRLIAFPALSEASGEKRHFRDLSPLGVLLEDRSAQDELANLAVVTKTPIPEKLVRQTHFAWQVVKHLRSNAIVVANDNVTLGLGMGQTSRIASTLHALEQAGARAEGAVLASDGFFPATDNIDEMAKAGIAVIIQPGGSIKDPDVIAAADAHGIAMAFTHNRCFKH